MQKDLGQIITFYSYKGGVGRTMSLANIAVLLEKKGNKVLIIDWDLEAPGLERYFEQYISPLKTDGLIDFLIKAKDLPEMEEEDEDLDLLKKTFSLLDNFIIPVNLRKNSQLDLLRAGNTHSDDYADKILSFDWVGFFNRTPGFFPYFAYFLKEKYDYVLIDSRTGHTDAGGVCTMLLPDSLVLAFVPNNQNLSGVIALAKKATNYRKNSGDIRPIRIFPLPSRIEEQEKEKREFWHNKYKTAFEDVFEEIYDQSDLSMTDYFNKILIRQSTYFAFGEEIAVLDEKVTSKISLTQDYTDFLEKLIGKEKIYDLKGQVDTITKSNLKIVQLYALPDKQLKEKFDKFLKPIKERTSWLEILIGKDLFETEIKNINFQIEVADIVILLISADFLSVDAINSFREVLKRKQSDHKLTIILRPCLWDYFIEGKETQVFPSEGSIIELNDIAQEQTFTDIANTINKLLTKNQK
jgi:cellulose biosynthesis protein BcsQ